MTKEIIKARHGTPCNNCGMCCIAIRCPLGEKIFGAGVGRCPGLLDLESGGYVCGMVTQPQRYVPGKVMEHGRDRVIAAAAFIVGAGMGCDAALDGEAQNPEWMLGWWEWTKSEEASQAAAVAMWIFDMTNFRPSEYRSKML